MPLDVLAVNIAKNYTDMKEFGGSSGNIKKRVTDLEIQVNNILEFSEDISEDEINQLFQDSV